MPSEQTYRLHFDPQGELLAAARACEAEVFLRWFGNTSEQLDDEYGPYDQASVFIAVADERGEVSGACRLILPSPVGLKTLNDVGNDPWQVDGPRSAHAANVDPHQTWDVATLGVRAKLGSAGLFTAAALYHGLIVATRVNRIPSVVFMIDERVRGMLTSTGLLTHPLPGTSPAPYLGSPSTIPVYGFCAQMVDDQRRINPDAHRLIAQGVGLTTIAPADPASFVLNRRPQFIDLPKPSMSRQSH